LTVVARSRTLKTGPVKRRTFLHVLGVDLGGGKGKKTAVATVRVDPHGGATVVGVAPRPGAAPLYDAALLEMLRGFGDGTLLCLDAPLTLPPCLRCRVDVCPGQEACVDPAVIAMRRLVAGGGASALGDRDRRRDDRRGKPSITPYTQRVTELHLLHQRGLAPREGLGQGTGPLAARAAHLVRALADRYRLNENLIEVFPKGTLAALGFARPYKKHMHERQTRAYILEALAPELSFGPGVWRELCVQSDHLFEAVICAFTGYLWARDAWSAPDAMAALVHHDGWIWIPPAPDASEPAEPRAKRAAEG
jgi:predicted RNase H-like nuclease